MRIHRLLTDTLLFTLWAIASPFTALSALADERVNTTSETLLDRIQVEDFMNDYYWELAAGEEEGISDFWAEDAVFDVNGDVYQGLEAIEEVYGRGLGPGGQLVFQMDIPRIRIEGDKALVDLIYTGILNTAPDVAPRLYEQGHDHVELIKTDGEWKIEKRVLRTFSLDQTFAE